MNVSVGAEALTAELDLVGRVIDPRSVYPNARCVLLEAERKALLLSATDLTISFRTSVEADVETAGRMLVPAVDIGGLARTLSGPTQLFEDKDHWLEVQAGLSMARLPAQDAADFPALPEEPQGPGADREAYSVPVGVMVLLLAKTLYLAQSSNAKNMPWIRLLFDKNRVSASATDGHRLAHATQEFHTADRGLQLLLPHKAAKL